jgi:MerR family transcriptional regulator, light-induced transcriptional regulator
MINSLSNLLPVGSRLSLDGLSNLVLSAFDSGASRKSKFQKSDSLDISTGENCQKSLLSVIESQIIPRLMDAHPGQGLQTSDNPAASRQFTEAELEAFSTICLSNDPEESLSHVKNIIAQGVSLESIFLDLITPAARWLGSQWEEDKMDFTAVTHGLMRMHQITRNLGYVNTQSPQTGSEVKRILLACAPGSMHILGLAIVAEFFRSNGWQVVVDISSTETTLAQALKREWFDMIGLSVGLVEQLHELPHLISELKSQALNPSTLVILGGPAALLSSDIAKKSGADGVATQADKAVELANGLLKAQ